MYHAALLTYIHKNRNKFNLSTNSYNTRRNDLINLAEPKCSTTLGLRHSANFGPRLYNRFINAYPQLESSNLYRFKRILKAITYEEITTVDHV